jgi:hypothetical protein
MGSPDLRLPPRSALHAGPHEAIPSSVGTSTALKRNFPDLHVFALTKPKSRICACRWTYIAGGTTRSWSPPSEGPGVVASFVLFSIELLPIKFKNWPVRSARDIYFISRQDRAPRVDIANCILEGKSWLTA